MIKITLTNDILKKISAIDENRFSLKTIELPQVTTNRLRKNSKKKSSYASNKIEGNPLTEAQANGCIAVAFGCTSGVSDILAPHGINGFIIPAFDEDLYAQTLLEITSMSKEQQDKIRLSAIKKRLGYTPEIIGEKWKLLFDNLVITKTL